MDRTLITEGPAYYGCEEECTKRVATGCKTRTAADRGAHPPALLPRKETVVLTTFLSKYTLRRLSLGSCLPISYRGVEFRSNASIACRIYGRPLAPLSSPGLFRTNIQPERSEVLQLLFHIPWRTPLFLQISSLHTMCIMTCRRATSRCRTWICLPCGRATPPDTTTLSRIRSVDKFRETPLLLMLSWIVALSRESDMLLMSLCPMHQSRCMFGWETSRQMN